VTLLMTVERQKEISNNYGRQTRADFGSSAAKLSGSTRPCDPDLP
jgi:hypothetical protein